MALLRQLWIWNLKTWTSVPAGSLVHLLSQQILRANSVSGTVLATKAAMGRQAWLLTLGLLSSTALSIVEMQGSVVEDQL